jgi:hypothetical protein
LPAWPTRPPPAATTISRTDTSSAESTVYAVRYHPIGEVHEAIPEDVSSRAPSRAAFDIEAQHDDDDDTSSSHSNKQSISITTTDSPSPPNPATRLWHALDSLNPFRRARHNPPPEVSAHQPSPAHKIPPESSRWDLLGRLEDFAIAQARRAIARTHASDDTAALPVTRIAAPPRRSTVREIQEELERDEAAAMGQAQEREHARPPELEPQRAYRGSLAFVAPVQRDWEGQEHEALGTRGAVAVSPAAVGPQMETRSAPGRGRVPGAENLPVLRIPAPPMRGRAGGE